MLSFMDLREAKCSGLRVSGVGYDIDASFSQVEDNHIIVWDSSVMGY